MSRTSYVVLSVVVGFLMALSMLEAQQATQSAPTYTAAQAAAGKTAYDASCASCHGGNLDDGALAAPLKGVAFVQKYGGKSVENLFAKVTTMPPASPGSLGAATTARVVAYLLQANAIVAGRSELPTDQASLARMIVPVGGFSVTSFSPYAPALPAVKRANPLDTFTPVSDAQLVEPAAQDWLTWRRAYDAQGFSPLSQITARNVAGLRVAWSWSLPPGSSESTPLVHDGVMFVQGANDKVQALDARTGDLLWQYERRLPEGVAGSFKRGLALHGNRLYMGTSDVHVIALDVKTGTVVWDQVVGDPKVREQIGGGALVARGKVMMGTVGTGVGAKPGGPEIVGLDEETGRIAWRVHTIAQPGTPGGDSWNGVPVERRSGASVWTPGSYDPGSGLAYFGTGNTYDTGPLVKPNGTPGVTNDALYTDSTLAIDPDTGTVKWHFQHHPNDQWDLDWAFERQLARLPVNGENRTVMFTAGKIGIYDALDAKSGQYLFSIDLGLNNLVTRIDPKTGAKTTKPDLVPGDGQVKMVCPHAAGAKNWLPASYSPASRTLFVPLVEACMDLFPVPGGGRGGLSTGVNLGVRPRPDSDGNYGRLQAINLETRKTVWTTRHRAPITTGTLTTAGGVVFAGALDRYLRAYDAANGKVLWETRLNDASSAVPISYAVNGKQYVAIVAGRGGFHYASYAPLVPELAAPPDRGSSVWVFELP
ncbi:MAG TPA: PQQ-binding-like beta-propeller repeat protein [Vicinamibacterales bacterium]|jgi:alcohol dehydrogenase (cytochrome c)|nr:PQQ-binding-like beta-propeller repeat protein [Vicinamibacterales bacterium]